MGCFFLKIFFSLRSTRAARETVARSWVEHGPFDAVLGFSEGAAVAARVSAAFSIPGILFAAPGRSAFFEDGGVSGFVPTVPFFFLSLVRFLIIFKKKKKKKKKKTTTTNIVAGPSSRRWVLRQRCTLPAPVIRLSRLNHLGSLRPGQICSRAATQP
jgi:hypothetical protein